MAQAQQYLSAGLQTASEIGAFIPLLFALPLAALLSADHGNKKEAVVLYALASKYPFIATSRWCEDLFDRHIATVAATLPPDVVAAAQEQGKARNIWATAEDLLAEIMEWS